MIDIQEKKRKILAFLENHGPSLPIRIAKSIDMEPVFAAAIISELSDSKQIRSSNMRVGSSPLYFIPGQERKLENHSENLKSVENNAYLKIKENLILYDEEESPAIRVALRSIRDFAIPIKIEEKIAWKYAFCTDEELSKILSKKPTESTTKQEKNEEDEDIKDKESENQSVKENIEDEPEEEVEKINEEVEKIPKAWEAKKEEIMQAREKSKEVENIFSPEQEAERVEPEFLIEVKKFLEKEKIKFLDEIRSEKKEIMATVQINTQLGDTTFLMVAKNKKTITRDELEAAIQIAIKYKMPCLVAIKKDPSSAIQKFIDENNLLKLLSME